MGSSRGFPRDQCRIGFGAGEFAHVAGRENPARYSPWYRRETGSMISRAQAESHGAHQHQLLNCWDSWVAISRRGQPPKSQAQRDASADLQVLEQPQIDGSNYPARTHPVGRSGLVETRMRRRVHGLKRCANGRRSANTWVCPPRRGAKSVAAQPYPLQEMYLQPATSTKRSAMFESRVLLLTILGSA